MSEPIATFDKANNRLILHRPMLVVLCGPSGAGKSTFAAKHFPPAWVVSSDTLRRAICDDERNLDSTDDAMRLLDNITELRLKYGCSCVTDSTALSVSRRRKMLAVAAKYGFPSLLLVLDTPFEVCVARDAARTDPPPVGPKVVATHYKQFNEARREMYQDGFTNIITLTEDDRAALTLDHTAARKPPAPVPSGPPEYVPPPR